jgi:hypothetical protein
MKKIDIYFYSYRPRLKVGLTWTTDLIPNVGDEIRIKSKFISQLDKKYFPQWMKDCSMTFRVKKRVWNLDEKKYWQDYDVRLELDWSEDELVKVEKYLDEFKKALAKKEKKKNDTTNSQLEHGCSACV